MHNIAIEPGLTPVSKYLSGKGYNIENISSAETAGRKYDAYIVTGMNTDLMGISDTETNAVVIQAKGMTPEEVYSELQKRLQ